MKPEVYKFSSGRKTSGTLLLGITILILPLLMSCNRTKTEYYDNGNKKSELTYNGGKLQGVATWWYANGEKKMESHYENGKLEGKSIRWHKNGKFERIEHYKSDKLHGRVATFSIRGKQLSEENYVNDTLHGTYKVWHPNGQIKVTGKYHMGLYDGKWIYRNEQGTIVGLGDFDQGTGTLTHYYENGRKERVVHYIDNQKHGQEVFWAEDGDMEARVIYDRGEVLSKYGMD
ncbi:MAG: toxin-antitoxin system YwqK family antitoxin [Bacteroidales bacterium]|nr:toxin-antitoxin system YwqK family antitoxin [Bacteroidales bacterium]